MSAPKPLPAIKPCPFCGYGHISPVSNTYGDHWEECDKCFARGPSKATPRAAKAAWNRRETT